MTDTIIMNTSNTNLEHYLEQLKSIEGDGLKLDFDRGRILDRVASEWKQSGQWTKAIEQSKIIGARQAFNLREMFTKFGKEEKRWVAVGAPATLLMTLLKASSELRDAIYEDFAQGNRWTVREALKAVETEQRSKNGDRAPQESLWYSRGGARTLGRFAELATRRALADFINFVTNVIDTLENVGATKPLSTSKRLLSARADAAEALKRFERVFTTVITTRNGPSISGFSVPTESREPIMTAVRLVLDRIARGKHPSEPHVTKWLSDEALPILNWVIGESEVPIDAASRAFTAVANTPEKAAAWLFNPTPLQAKKIPSSNADVDQATDIGGPAVPTGSENRDLVASGMLEGAERRLQRKTEPEKPQRIPPTNSDAWIQTPEVTDAELEEAYHISPIPTPR